jgi:hypothetical protein
VVQIVAGGLVVQIVEGRFVALSVAGVRRVGCALLSLCVVVALTLMRVLDRPSQPLDELVGEVLAFKVRLGDPLAEHDRALAVPSARICCHDDMRHRASPLWLVSCRRLGAHGGLQRQ